MAKLRRQERAVSTAAADAKPPSGPNERLWTALLVGAAAVAFGLLGREVADAFADRNRPAFFQNDLHSALTSAVVLAVVGVFAYKRARRAAASTSRSKIV
ncbi:MAG: hypothetical protein NVSMB19_26760 [Vulcanimicrobiaceae bacterium]